MPLRQQNQTDSHEMEKMRAEMQSINVKLEKLLEEISTMKMFHEETKVMQEQIKNVQKRVDTIENQRAELKKELLPDIQQMIDSNVKAALKTYEEEIKARIKKEIQQDIQEMIDISIQSALNPFEQRSRDFNLRVHGLHIPKTCVSTKEECSFIFNELIKPILSLSKSENYPVPEEWTQVISVGHSLPTRKNDPTPVYHLRLRAKHYVETIVQNKGRYLRSVTAGKKVYINKDLTTMNRKKMEEMKKNPLVENIWYTQNSRLRMKLKGHDKIITVQPQDTIEEIIFKKT